MKNKYLKLLLLAFIMISVIGCNKDNSQEIDSENLQANERTYLHKKCLDLNDGEFSATYCIYSDLQSEIDKIIDLKPSIKVRPYNKVDLKLNKQSPLPLENEIAKEYEKSEYDLLEEIQSHNIPSGYSLEIIFLNKNSSIDLRSSGYGNKEMKDSGAVGVYVAYHPDHQVPCSFYSKGCCFYNKYWYFDRGGYTISLYNTNSHSFETEDYTSYSGAMMRAYTTQTAWNNLTRYFYY